MPLAHGVAAKTVSHLRECIRTESLHAPYRCAGVDDKGLGKAHPAGWTLFAQKFISHGNRQDSTRAREVCQNADSRLAFYAVNVLMNEFTLRIHPQQSITCADPASPVSKGLHCAGGILADDAEKAETREKTVSRQLTVLHHAIHV